MNRAVEFIPKRIAGERQPWLRFGSTKSEYQRWIPEVCGICCLKMIGDTLNKTDELSLYLLTLRCLERGGFRILESGKIEGIFHRPLLKLAQEVGLQGEVKGYIDNDLIVESVKNDRFVILSIDLMRATHSIAGSHLILIHGYDLSTEEFVFHDPSQIIDEVGRNARISQYHLEEISNKKGLIIWEGGEKVG